MRKTSSCAKPSTGGADQVQRLLLARRDSGQPRGSVFLPVETSSEARFDAVEWPFRLSGGGRGSRVQTDPRSLVHRQFELCLFLCKTPANAGGPAFGMIS